MWCRLATLPLLAMLSTGPAVAQHHADAGWRGDGHAQNHDWYQDLKQPGTGYSCCNGSARGNEGDCRPTRAYQDDEGRWFALLNGRWVAIAPQVILEPMSPDGRSHICANPYGRIFCFLRGSPRS